MSRAFGFIAVLIVVAAAMYIYMQQLKSVSPKGAGAAPQMTLDLIGVRNDLLQFARDEQQHLATDGHYVTLDEMRAAGDTGLPNASRGPYVYSIDVTSDSFTATATYQGTPPQGVPHVLTIGPESTISSE